MRVALVCPYAWDRPGGVQTHVRALARKLTERGHEVLVVAPASRGRTTSDADYRVAVDGRAVPVPANGSVAPISLGPRVAGRVGKELADFGPEVLHLHEPLIPSVSWIALRVSDVPAVGTFHAATESSLGYRAGRRILEGAAARLAVRTAVSPAARALISRYFPGDYVMTPNGVDVKRFSTAEPLDPGGKKKVLFLSRIERRKGLQVLIQAMAAQRDLGARLVVAGGGPRERSCKSLADDLLVETQWLSHLDDDDVARTYASADAFCAPALGGESFGIILLEAMAAGAPVICSDLPAFRAVAGEAALYAEPGNPAALGAALRRVLTDEEVSRSLVDAGREVAARHDWERLVGGIELAYEMALGKKKATVRK